MKRRRTRTAEALIAELDALWPEALTLLAMGLSILLVASLRFRKGMD